LVTVDDDPGVARDLLQRHGPDYRAVRAEPGPQVLKALRETELHMTGRRLTSPPRRDFSPRRRRTLRPGWI